MANRASFVIIAKDAFTVVGRRVAATTGKMTRGFKTLSKRLTLTTGRFDGLILSLGAFFGARKILTEGTKFEDSIADLAAITGAAGEDLKFFADESLRLSKIAVIGASETATAFKLVASAKAELLKDPKALSNVTEQTLLLANASGIDLSTSALVVTQSLNQFGAAADQANRFVNVLAAGSKFGASEVAQTGTAIVKSAVAAKFAKLDFEELNGVIQVLAQRGVTAEIAGTQLKTSLIKLEAQGIARIKPSVVGFTQALRNMSAMSLNAAQLQKLFGLEAIITGSIMIDSADAIDSMIGKLRGTNIASQQASIRLNTFSKRIKGIGILIDEKLITAFNKLDSPLNKMVDDFEKFIITINDKDIQQFADTMKFTADVIITIGKGVGVIVDGLKELGKFLGTGTAIIFDKNLSIIEKSTALGREQFKLAKGIAEITGGTATTARGAGSIPTPFGLSQDTSIIQQLISQSLNVRSQGDFTLTVKDPGNHVESVKTTAKTPFLMMGVNMETGS